MKVKHKGRQNVAITVKGIRYETGDGVLTVDSKVGNVILTTYPDWGQANPTTKKCKVKNG